MYNTIHFASRSSSLIAKKEKYFMCAHKWAKSPWCSISRSSTASGGEFDEAFVKSLWPLVADLVGFKNRVAAASYKRPSIVAISDQPNTINSSSSSRPCGKTCSYESDAREEGKYYPLLLKVVNCPDIFHRMAWNFHPVVRPPPRRPPPELLGKFTMDGQCPVSRFWYLDNSTVVKKPAQTYFNATTFRKLLEKENLTNVNSYRDKNVLKPALVKYEHLIRGKRIAVVGTEKPWAEAMLVNLGANSITTIEYRQLVIEHERVITITLDRLAKLFISGHGDPFDTVFTYSSLEHSGLGRYGDPITPFGDLEATAQIWCMVKPGGHLILAVPASDNRTTCSVVWNAHRIYGAVRLQHLTANWRVLDAFNAMDVGQNHIFVLQKKTFV